MFLEKLNLHHFKNYDELEAEFSSGINCLFGRNGSGKTNLLDAIYYLSFTKSAFAGSDAQNIQTGHDQFVIRGRFRNDHSAEVVCACQAGHKKSVRENEQEYTKMSDHIGKYPVVMIAPNDIELIWDGSEQRRRFFDSLISQIDRSYLEHLIQYQQYLKQRNGLLRLAADRGSVDRDLLDTYNQKLVPLARFIFERRQHFVQAFTPQFVDAYHFLSGNAAEKVSLRYQSELEGESYDTILKRTLSRDLQLQRTTSGIHRDDFVFLLDGHELKRYGSQGQQKSFLIGLKVTEFRELARSKGQNPILLLDDIFDKLDDLRIQKLMQMVAEGSFGQLFITDARADRSRDIIKELGIQASAYQVENGKLATLHV